MLVLSRDVGETVVIGDHVRVKVEQVRGNKALLAIDAPQHVAVHRYELWVSIQRQRAQGVEQ